MAKARRSINCSPSLILVCDLRAAPSEAKEAQKPYIAEKKPGRNDPCHCGSGKKYKKCHGI